MRVIHAGFFLYWNKGYPEKKQKDHTVLFTSSDRIKMIIILTKILEKKAKVSILSGKIYFTVFIIKEIYHDLR